MKNGGSCVKDADLSGCLVDAHVHIYDCFHLPAVFDAATEHAVGIDALYRFYGFLLDVCFCQKLQMSMFISNFRTMLQRVRPLR